MELFNLLLISLLIILTAFFVASEFAIVKVRATRIQQLADEGNKNAESTLRILQNLDGYLSACQLGITLTALGLGWVGEPTVEHIIRPLLIPLGLPLQLTAIISIALAFSIITFLHVVVGELAPKTLAIQKAETISLWSARPLILFYKIMYPFIWVLNGSARGIIGIFGLEPANEHDIAHTEEEIRTILNQSYTSGEINKEELKYMNNIFQFDDRLAKEIMVPRTEISVINSDSSLEEIIQVIKEEQYTRFPIASHGDKDEIIGIVHTKELFLSLIEHKAESIKQFIRPVLTVPESIPIRELLKKMQKQGNHMAILIDEYGGTAGLVTVEDILEEIVGDIRDEFDKEEEPLIRQINPKKYIFDGKVLVTDVNRLLQTRLDDEEIDTIGGWVYTHAPELKEGLSFQDENLAITIVELDHHRIKKLEIEKLE